MSTNKIFIAAAGSGKTKFIVDDVLNNQPNKVLITTFTNANEQSIRERLAVANGGSLPSGVIIQPWFSFLLEHGVRPYRFWDKKDNGLNLVSEKSGYRFTNGDGQKIYWGEKDFSNYYFDSSMRVYSDKISKLVFECNKNSKGYVVGRLEKIFNYIFIDEVQDMAGWDFEIIKLLMQSSITVIMVGDQRQAVYKTNPAPKYKKYANGKIADFITNECKNITCEIDTSTLKTSYRNSQEICELSLKLYPHLPSCCSGLKCTSTHMGIYLVRKEDVENYANCIDDADYEFNFERKSRGIKFVQLRNNKTTKDVMSDREVLNFGISKGLEFYHILIYPTKPMLNWLEDNNFGLKEGARADFYVALTRAFFSVGIVVPDDFNVNIDNIKTWSAIK